jgi:hypothetical protein
MLSRSIGGPVKGAAFSGLRSHSSCRCDRNFRAAFIGSRTTSMMMRSGVRRSDRGSSSLYPSVSSLAWAPASLNPRTEANEKVSLEFQPSPNGRTLTLPGSHNFKRLKRSSGPYAFVLGRYSVTAPTSAWCRRSRSLRQSESRRRRRMHCARAGAAPRRSRRCRGVEAGKRPRLLIQGSSV